jgi:[ribosomal protein S18]-alanine N-acetyltransferase
MLIKPVMPAESKKWRIIALKEEYLDQVLEIEKQSFSTPWSRINFLKEFENPETCFWLMALTDKKVAGYMGYWRIEKEAHITNLAVAKNYRRLGLGTFLAHEILVHCKNQGCQRATLEVRASNQAAIDLYAKFGFEPVAIRPKYYQREKEDALIMWKNSL